MKRRIALAAALAGAALAVTLAGPAGAAEPASQCNATVIDTTARHALGPNPGFGAVRDLQAKGADVRVRVMDAAPGGSLDAYEEAQIAACPSWRLNGQIKPNLIVFAVSMDHQDAVFYGKNYARMQDQVDQIRADMGGQFRDGDFTGGVSKGAQEAYGALWPSGLPGWVWLLIILVIVVVVLGMAAAGGGRGGGRRYGGGGYTYIGGNSYGGGGSSSGGGGSAGGSSGSW